MKRIVLVDDVPANLSLLKGYLRILGDVELYAFDRSLEAIAWCMESPPDLIITDYMMPELDGLDFLHQIRGQDRLKETPVIMVTSSDDRSTLYEALNFGFTDFLRSPIDRAEFVARTRNMLELGRRQRELRIANDTLSRQASTDALTGIPNRRHFLEMAGSFLSDRPAAPCCLAIADIDHFKRINDLHGHDGGDEVLRQTAKRISRGMRGIGSCGRLGGEEFGLFFPGLTLTEATATCERIVEGIRGHVIELATVGVRCTLSMGVSERMAGEDVSGLMKRADQLLYAAKQGGRDRVSFGGRAPQGGVDAEELVDERVSARSKLEPA